MKRFGRGIARQWDDTQVISYERKEAGKETRVRVHCQPYDEFETFHLVCSKPIKQIKQMWQALIESRKTGAWKIMGHWCFALSYQDPT